VRFARTQWVTAVMGSEGNYYLQQKQIIRFTRRGELKLLSRSRNSFWKQRSELLRWSTRNYWQQNSKTQIMQM